jgi:two-component system NarL family sensor kinase
MLDDMRDVAPGDAGPLQQVVTTRPAGNEAPNGVWCVDDEECPREVALLNAVAEELNSSLNLPQALERTLALIGDFLALPTGWVWLQDPDTRQFYLAASRNLPPFLQEPVKMTGAQCLCMGLFREKRLSSSNIAAVSCSRLAEAFEAGVPESTLGLRSHASVPLYFQDRPLGIMNLSNPEDRTLTGEDLRMLETLACQIGTAVERARLADEATRLARAEERSRIAREIHDTLAQDLTAIGLDLEGALRHLEENPERTRERLERALATTRESLEEARRSVLDLRGGPLEGRSLVDSLQALSRSFTSDTGLPVHLTSTVQAALPLRVELELYRIVQEALTNVRKHARATQVRVDLNAGSENVELSIRDNGVGFESGQAHSGGLGLIGMRERVQLLGGRIRVESQAGRGTKVSVRAPLPAEPEA